MSKRYKYIPVLILNSENIFNIKKFKNISKKLTNLLIHGFNITMKKRNSLFYQYLLVYDNLLDHQSESYRNHIKAINQFKDQINFKIVTYNEYIDEIFMKILHEIHHSIIIYSSNNDFIWREIIRHLSIRRRSTLFILDPYINNYYKVRSIFDLDLLPWDQMILPF